MKHRYQRQGAWVARTRTIAPYGQKESTYYRRRNRFGHRRLVRVTETFSIDEEVRISRHHYRTPRKHTWVFGRFNFYVQCNDNFLGLPLAPVAAWRTQCSGESIQQSPDESEQQGCIHIDLGLFILAWTLGLAVTLPCRIRNPRNAFHPINPKP